VCVCVCMSVCVCVFVKSKKQFEENIILHIILFNFGILLLDFH